MSMVGGVCGYMLIVLSTTSAVVAGPMRDEGNIWRFNIENTRVEETAEDVSTTEGEIASNRRTCRARTDGAV